MTESFISRMGDRFRNGMVRVCVTIGTVLIVIAVAAILLPFVLGALFLAMAQRLGRRDLEPAQIVVQAPCPIGAPANSVDFGKTPARVWAGCLATELKSAAQSDCKPDEGNRRFRLT